MCIRTHKVMQKCRLFYANSTKPFIEEIFTSALSPPSGNIPINCKDKNIYNIARFPDFVTKKSK